jgi:hypothetical protein
MLPSPTPGPRLREKHRLSSTTIHSSIGSLFTVLDMLDAHEQLTFRETLRALGIDPTMGYGHGRRESTKLNNDGLRGLATRFLNQKRLPPHDLTAGQTCFSSSSIATLHCLRLKKYSYDEHREDIIRLLTQVLISQRDGLRRREREKERERFDQLPSIRQGDASLARESSSDSGACSRSKSRPLETEKFIRHSTNEQTTLQASGSAIVALYTRSFTLLSIYATCKHKSQN